MVRRRPSPSATSIGSPLSDEASVGRRASTLLQLATEHQRDQLQPRQIGGRTPSPTRRPLRNTEMRSAICVDLVDEMGDEDDCDAVRFEIAHDLEQQLGLGRVEAGRRLVQHEHARVLLERAGDGDQLLDRHRIGAERPFDVDVEIEPLAAAGGPRSRDPRQEISPKRRGWRSSVRFLVTDMVGIEVDFLIDRADAQRARLAGGVDARPAAVEANLALVAHARRRS